MNAHDEAVDLKRLYAPPKTPVLVTVPPFDFIMIDGQGDPNSSAAYREAVEALYALSYTLTFALKKDGVVERVRPLEGLWWSDDFADFTAGRKDAWHWTAMIAQPAAVTPERFARAQAEAGAKRPLPGLARARLERFDEGPCAQVMHIGPYSAEGPTIARLHEFIRAQGCAFDGRRQKHHEIYLGDPRRAAPDKLKTIIRQPVTRAPADEPS